MEPCGPGVGLAEGALRDRALARLEDYWGEAVVVRQTRYRLADCEIYAAQDLSGAAAVALDGSAVAELVALNAFSAGRGVGTALLEAIAADLEGHARLRLVTTNDNLDALRFYQRRGFRLADIRFGAVERARIEKPSIPQIGDYGIPIRDEIELECGLPAPCAGALEAPASAARVDFAGPIL
ncbi:MAG TPA: GNAT family N-acetyltransferase [Caulobacteraceae bacterium]|nr:GNAT family N-acetyltransferase [Caulobacteraceae bacterium]